MSKRKNVPVGLAMFAVAAFAISLAIPALADDYWDTSEYVKPTPASSDWGDMEGLAAKVRGLDDTDGNEIGISSWTWFISDECLIRRSPPKGTMIIIR